MGRKKKEANANSVWWNGTEPGESITGKFLHFESITRNKGKRDEYTQPVVVLQVENEVKKISCGYVLAQIFGTIAEKMKSGRPVSVTFNEEKKNGKKRLRIFSVLYDGKNIPQPSASVPVDRKDLKTLFAHSAKTE